VLYQHRLACTRNQSPAKAIKPFTSLLTLRHNKLECFFPLNAACQPGLTFVNEAGDQCYKTFLSHLFSREREATAVFLRALYFQPSLTFVTA
jgi:hypothetical protein